MNNTLRVLLAGLFAVTLLAGCSKEAEQAADAAKTEMSEAVDASTEAAATVAEDAVDATKEAASDAAAATKEAATEVKEEAVDAIQAAKDAAAAEAAK